MLPCALVPRTGLLQSYRSEKGRKFANLLELEIRNIRKLVFQLKFDQKIGFISQISQIIGRLAQ